MNPKQEIIEVLREQDTYLRATIWREYLKDGRVTRPLFSFRDFKTQGEAEKYLSDYVGKKGVFSNGINYEFKTSINLVHLVPAPSFLYGLNW